MARLVIADVMDAIADTLIEAEILPRVYAYPAGNVTVPAAVVSYPAEDIDFDVTFKNGSDRAVFPVFFLVGKATDKAARDTLSEIISGASDIKAALDGTLGDVVQTARVTGLRVESVTVAGADYLSATASIEVYS